MTKETPPVEPTAPNAAQHAPEAVKSLRHAMRRARADDAERIGALSELRSMQLGRLELLHEKLKPLLEEIPPDAAELFDMGLMPGATPRLFVDMLGFVEMGRDARLYRLLQDTRYRRLTIAETNDVATMVDAITQYVARRLLERDKALAADTTEAELGPPRRTREAAPAMPRQRRRSPGVFGVFAILFAFVIDLLGALAFFSILAAAGWYLWTRTYGQG